MRQPGNHPASGVHQPDRRPPIPRPSVRRAAADPRLQELEARIASADEASKVQLQLELADLRSTLRAEKISEVAASFDGIHNIHRAVQVGSVDAVIQAEEIRPRIIAEIERGLAQG
jgi:hypothetical protein